MDIFFLGAIIEIESLQILTTFALLLGIMENKIWHVEDGIYEILSKFGHNSQKSQFTKVCSKLLEAHNGFLWPSRIKLSHLIFARIFETSNLKLN